MNRRPTGPGRPAKAPAGSRSSVGTRPAPGRPQGEEDPMSYQDLIRRDLAQWSLIGMDPRHVEASMRCVFGTLDHLGGPEWTAAVREAVAEVQAMGPEMSEALAQSWGL